MYVHVYTFFNKNLKQGTSVTRMYTYLDLENRNIKFTKNYIFSRDSKEVKKEYYGKYT